MSALNLQTTQQTIYLERWAVIGHAMEHKHYIYINLIRFKRKSE